MARFDLTDFAWSVIQPLSPTKARGKLRVDEWRILKAVSEACDGDIQMIDNSSIRVHPHAANGQKKAPDPPETHRRAGP